MRQRYTLNSVDDEDTRSEDVLELQEWAAAVLNVARVISCQPWFSLHVPCTHHLVESLTEEGKAGKEK